MHSGRLEGLPYSLSRWTDVPAAKWPWFKAALASGSMMAFDPLTAIPGEWSLRPNDTLGLIFWTKDPTNIRKDLKLLLPRSLQVHVTITGWEEAEPGVPSWVNVAGETAMLADHIGKERIEWRFSPVPLIQERRVPRQLAQGSSLTGTGLLDRFERIGRTLSGYVRTVYLSFLQPNDLIPETRDVGERVALMREMAAIAAGFGMQVRLCAEDRALQGAGDLPWNLAPGICSDASLWASNEPVGGFPKEGCGCVRAVDPFTINESCTMGCRYCYAGDVSLAEKKRNTTRKLPVVR